MGEGRFEVYSSSGPVINWVLRETVTNAALATGVVEVGVWAGCYAGGNAACTGGTARFDWAEIIQGVPAGDFNEDGVVDTADYVVWRDTMGQAVTAWDGADGTGDGMVTQADYDAWKQNFGKTIPNLSGSGSSLVQVPEPNSVGFLLLWSCGLTLMARRRTDRTKRRRMAG